MSWGGGGGVPKYGRNRQNLYWSLAWTLLLVEYRYDQEKFLNRKTHLDNLYFLYIRPNVTSKSKHYLRPTLGKSIRPRSNLTDSTPNLLKVYISLCCNKLNSVTSRRLQC